MKTLDDILTKLGQSDSPMYSIESALIAVQVEGASEATKRSLDLLYILREQVEQSTADLEELNGHIKVCNAVFAVNRVEELKAEIENLKQGG